MMFGVYRDDGASIHAFLIPDSGGTVPAVQIRGANKDLLTMDANEVRPELIAAGRHATGLCGFRIDQTLVPDLADYPDLEIIERRSGIIIYRRKNPSFSEQKVFRLETHLLPLWRVDDALKRHFQYWYKGIDRQGAETTMQAFCLPEGSSTFISGRLLVNNLHIHLSKGFKTIAMFREPYEELAERLILLKSANQQTRDLLGARDTMTFEIVMEALGEIETFDRASLKRFFKRAQTPVFKALANPLIRLLTSATPDEMPGKASMATALQQLAEFDVLALRSDAGHFAQSVSEALGIGELALPPVSEYQRVIDLGNILRENHDAEMILEKDLELYNYAAPAFKTHPEDGEVVTAAPAASSN